MQFKIIPSDKHYKYFLDTITNRSRLYDDLEKTLYWDQHLDRDEWLCDHLIHLEYEV